jgi:hypothetical protein
MSAVTQTVRLANVVLPDETQVCTAAGTIRLNQINFASSTMQTCLLPNMSEPLAVAPAARLVGPMALLDQA